MRIELRAKCPQCGAVRVLWGPWIAKTPDDLDHMEDEIDARGHATALCDQCDAVEDVALFIDDCQTEPWQNADDYESRGGPDAGPLPPKPW